MLVFIGGFVYWFGCYLPFFCSLFVSVCVYVSLCDFVCLVIFNFFIFVAACGLSLVVASRGYSSLQYMVASLVAEHRL